MTGQRVPATDAGARGRKRCGARALSCARRLAIGLAAGLALPAPAAEPDAETAHHTDIVVGVERSRGDYGDPRATRMTTVPLTLRHRRGPWLLQLDLPWQRIDSPSDVLPGVGPVDGAGHGGSVAQGLGDAWLKLGWEWLEADAGSPGVDLVLKWKTHTGRLEQGLGSGADDVALQAEATWRAGPLTGFGHLGYRHTGDVPGRRPYRDPWYGELGFTHPLPGRCDIGAFHDLRQAIGSLGRLSETSLYGGCASGPHRVQLMLTRGWGGASADLSLGLSLRRRF